MSETTEPLPPTERPLPYGMPIPAQRAAETSAAAGPSPDPSLDRLLAAKDLGQPPPKPPAKIATWLDNPPSPPPSPPPAAPRTSESGRRSNGSSVGVLVGGVLISIGTLMPWLIAWQPATGTITQNGIGNGTGDGVIILPIGILLAILGIVCLSVSVSPTIQKIMVIPAAIVLLIGWIDYQYISAKVANQIMTGFSMQIGIGIYVVLAGALMAVIGAGSARSAKKEKILDNGE